MLDDEKKMKYDGGRGRKDNIKGWESHEIKGNDGRLKIQLRGMWEGGKRERERTDDSWGW